MMTLKCATLRCSNASFAHSIRNISIVVFTPCAFANLNTVLTVGCTPVNLAAHRVLFHLKGGGKREYLCQRWSLLKLHRGNNSPFAASTGRRVRMAPGQGAIA
ncbi:hypothetical protein WOLCODRAFT_140698, partial [Wolfiporia cocos MD-104 SS10]